MTNAIGEGLTQGSLTTGQVERIIAQAAGRMALDGQRVLAVIPDHTRTCPLPLVTRLLDKHLRPRVAKLDAIIALGTHPPLDKDQVDKLLGGVPEGMEVFNHRWDDEASLVTLGQLEAAQVRAITGGKFEMDVDVKVNRLAMEYDALLVVGPVFPHEVAGFSGGSKYFFPGISGPEVTNFFHWLGAIITNPRIIGVKDTPIRATIEAAADMIPTRKLALCMVTSGHEERGMGSLPRCSTGILPVSATPADTAETAVTHTGKMPVPHLAGLYAGEVSEAWAAAAELSRQLHITYLDSPVQSVLSQAPEMYDELWVAAKCMYKLEPVVADGGELIIYAPHLREISATHGRLIEEIGYHTRDFFVAQWEKFRRYPWGVLAHSTHLRGSGTYEGGVERPRIRVTLASAIPEEICRKVNLGYRDPRTIDVRQWQGRADRLYVPRAGEMLYRLKDPPDWQKA